MAAILKIIRPDLKAAGRRSRCLGHIIHLAAKAFLFGNSVEAFETVTEGVDKTSVDLDSETMKKAQAAGRDKGVVGKLHNVAVYIRSSPQRREAFKRVILGDDETDSLMPILG
jgi:hypothetical protein